MSEGEKGSIIFTIIELLLIALLLLCNCLNLVSVLGFSAQTVKAAALSKDVDHDSNWQLAVLGNPNLDCNGGD